MFWFIWLYNNECTIFLHDEFGLILQIFMNFKEVADLREKVKVAINNNVTNNVT